MKKQLLPGILLLASAVSVLASPQYDEAAKYASSVKNQGMNVMTGTDPATTIPGYTAKPDESGYYGGTTASSNPDLENAGNSEMHNGETGKTIMEVIKNRPPDPISTDAPFVSDSLDVEGQAETITQGTDTQCKDVEVNKTQLINYTCERTSAVNLSCTRTATIENHQVTTTVTKTYQQAVTLNYRPGGWNGDLVIPATGVLKHITVNGDSLPIPWNSHCNKENHLTPECKASVAENIRLLGLSWQEVVTKYPNKTSYCTGGRNTHCTYYYNNGKGSLHQAADVNTAVSSMQTFPVTKTSRIQTSKHPALTLTVTLTLDEQVTTNNPEVVWTENCPFDKTDQVKLNTTCTQPGEDRTVTIDGRPYTIHSDCWQYIDNYVSQAADNGTCDTYMQSPACTVGATTCLDSLNGTCLREQVVFSCEEKTSGSAKLCGGELVCADGSCDQLDDSKSNGFQSAVSGLAALAAAGKDIAALNGVNVSAFTGEGHSCRKAMAGFSNCCKDSGWGHDVGLASCNTEEKALAEAKKRKLSIYVGSYCAHKVLGVCLEKKEGYCQFQSKLAKIIQDQGRRGQLGIGFGSGSSPDCRGLTVAELQRLKFDNINFADFYDDLENGATLPADQELLDRIKEQIAGKVTGGGQ